MRGPHGHVWPPGPVRRGCPSRAILPERAAEPFRLAAGRGGNQALPQKPCGRGRHRERYGSTGSGTTQQRQGETLHRGEVVTQGLGGRQGGGR